MEDFLVRLHGGRLEFRVADALDIAAVAVLVYWLLVWFRQSASRSLVLGVAAVTGLYFLARTLDMVMTSLVYQTAFAATLVVLVVLFQEELRRFFERIAHWGSLGQLRPKTAVLVERVDALVEGIMSMAGRRIGALIVLVGQEPLQRHLHGGIPLSGEITLPILYSIFDPHSVGHDGAVLIENERIAQFGAHLPISTNHRLLKGRGTRHAAALGIAERSDALVIVVSEERGIVSVAEANRIDEVATAGELKDRIDHFLEDRFPTKLESTWKRFLTRNGPLKLLALAMATTIWFALALTTEEVQTSFVVPIEYQNLPENAQLDRSSPVQALVTLSGSQRDFRLLDPEVLRIGVDLSQMEDPVDTIFLSEEDVSRPPNFRVDRIQPDEIRARLMRKPPRSQPSPGTP